MCFVVVEKPKLVHDKQGSKCTNAQKKMIQTHMFDTTSDPPRCAVTQAQVFNKNRATGHEGYRQEIIRGRRQPGHP